MVKIGTSANLAGRLAALAQQHGALTLLAVHVGSYVEEAFLHDRFADERHVARPDPSSCHQYANVTDWFVYSDRLQAHVGRLTDAAADAVFPGAFV